MAKLLKLRRGTTTQHNTFTGAEGEVTVDTTKDTAVVHDGAQAGGRPLAREDMSNVSSASIAGQLATDSIATTKIAAGALPTDVTIVDANISGNLTIASADIVDGSIVNDDINASAAIAKSKLANLDVVNADINASAAIAKSKLAALDVVNADVNASAAIAGSKIAPDFGSQNVATTGTISDGKGNVRSIPSNAQSGAYVAVAADAGKVIYISTGGVTFNNSVFSAGDAVSIINDSGSAQTLTAGAGVTLYNTGDATTGNRTLAGRGMATIWFASASVAYISGSGLS